MDHFALDVHGTSHDDDGIHGRDADGDPRHADDRTDNHADDKRSDRQHDDQCSHDDDHRGYSTGVINRDLAVGHDVCEFCFVDRFALGRHRSAASSKTRPIAAQILGDCQDHPDFPALLRRISLHGRDVLIDDEFDADFAARADANVRGDVNGGRVFQFDFWIGLSGDVAVSPADEINSGIF